jgi:hypothetical protein
MYRITGVNAANDTLHGPESVEQSLQQPAGDELHRIDPAARSRQLLTVRRQRAPCRLKSLPTGVGPLPRHARFAESLGERRHLLTGRSPRSAMTASPRFETSLKRLKCANSGHCRTAWRTVQMESQHAVVGSFPRSPSRGSTRREKRLPGMERGLARKRALSKRAEWDLATWMEAAAPAGGPKGQVSVA